MQFTMTKRIRRGWETTKPREVTVAEIVEITRKSEKLKIERLRAAKPCGCYKTVGFDREFKRLTGEEKNICLFHASYIGDEFSLGFSGTLDEIFGMNRQLGREPDFGLRKLRSPEMY